MLKQSLFQRPSCLINQLGVPAAAAVVTAPILNEREEYPECVEGRVSRKNLFKRRRVK